MREKLCARCASWRTTTSNKFLENCCASTTAMRKDFACWRWAATGGGCSSLTPISTFYFCWATKEWSRNCGRSSPNSRARYGTSDSVSVRPGALWKSASASKRTTPSFIWLCWIAGSWPGTQRSLKSSTRKFCPRRKSRHVLSCWRKSTV